MSWMLWSIHKHFHIYLKILGKERESTITFYFKSDLGILQRKLMPVSLWLLIFENAVEIIDTFLKSRLLLAKQASRV